MEVYSVKQGGNEVLRTHYTPVQGSKAPEKESGVKPESKAKKPQIVMDYPPLLEIAKQVQERLKSADVNIEFEIDKEANRIVIKIRDPISGEVVRKIPPESFAKIVNHLKELRFEGWYTGVELDVRF
ncbi:MAG: hypothetical protein Kow0042_31090 [Calditrichia bacterium]